MFGLMEYKNIKALPVHKSMRAGAMNPIIKFTTLFGLLAVETAVELKKQNPDSHLSVIIGSVCFLLARVFVYRSFCHIRITPEPAE